MIFNKKSSSPAATSKATAEKSRGQYSLEYTQIAIRKIVAQIDSSDIKDLTEEDTCNRFILPFFQAFGWNPVLSHWCSQFRIENSSQRVDYAFSKRGKGWAYIEAKRINFKNIDKNKNFVKQVSGYFNAAKNAHLIILTNGEEYCFYSYGENTEISATPFIKFNIRNINLTGNAKPLSRLFYNQFNIGDWPQLAEKSRALADIKYSLRNAPDSLTKQNNIERSFALLYPDMDVSQRKELIDFFNLFG